MDLQAGTSDLPANRMKEGREHHVALSAEAVTLLQAVKGDRQPEAGEHVFKGRKGQLR
jgi:integrase